MSSGRQNSSIWPSYFWDSLTTAGRVFLKSEPFNSFAFVVSTCLANAGVPSTHIPSPEQIGLSVSMAGLTLVVYYVSRGNMNSKRRKELEKNLNLAHKTVKDLEEKLFSLEALDIKENHSGREIRIWMDGAFDMMHFGHMNAFRQGRSLGTHLVVGVNSDSTITQCKGAPVMNDDERVEAVKACKWVDEVVSGVPYVMSEEYIAYVIEKYKIDYVVHGDDPCIVDGKDVYESAQKLGKYLTIPRTEGISTTDLVGRMLLMTKTHHSGSFTEEQMLMSSMTPNTPFVGFDRKTNFLTTSRTIKMFGAGVKAPERDAKVVYLAGAWDMFHSGHINILERAREYGDYVIVGVHNDAVTNSHRGMNLPIMNLHERVLSVLGCKYVDDVLIDAPYVITKEMIVSLNISVVLHGSITEDPNVSRPASSDDLSTAATIDPYVVPKEMGILRCLQSTSEMTVLDLVQRIQVQRSRFNQKYVKKRAAEEAFYAQKYKLNEGSTPTATTVSAAL